MALLTLKNIVPGKETWQDLVKAARSVARISESFAGVLPRSYDTVEQDELLLTVV
jgi:hypothetical protein